MSEILFDRISKHYDKEETIKNLTLKIEDGEIISLLGPSGCGKTTTLKILAGLVNPDFGTVYMDGINVNPLPAEKRGAVIVFQDHRLFPHMTVGGNIEFGLRMQKVPKRTRREKVEEMLKFMELEEHGGKFPDQISGGQKQRAAIARSLIINPKVLLLDEPFSNLDQRLKEEMRSFIVEIQKKLKITTILVTHDKEDALMTSKKIGVMFQGELKQYGTPEELYEEPSSIEVAKFFGEVNEFSIDHEDEHRIHTYLGAFNKTRLSMKRGVYYSKLLVRPEAVEIYYEEHSENMISGLVMERIYAGEKTYYSILCGERILKASVVGNCHWNEGQRVFLKIEGKNTMLVK